MRQTLTDQSSNTNNNHLSTPATTDHQHLHNQHLSSTADSENVRVIVRLRPGLQLVQPLDSSSSPRLITRELDGTCPYTLQPDRSSIHAAGSWYTFDGVYSPSSSTGEIYETHISPMIKDASKGYNSTLFAYGATGSGKSYSMIGSHREDGIVLRAVEDIFDIIEQDQEREYVVRVSYLEIYNEQLRDLLSNESQINHSNHSSSSSNNSHQPKIHEDRQGRIFVRPLVSTPCADPEDVIRLLIAGESRRRTERTEWNLRSSRSHAIFSLTLESRPVIGISGFPITSSTMREATGSGLSMRPLNNPSRQSTVDDIQNPSRAEVFLGTGPGKLPITPSVTRFKSSASSKASSGHGTDCSIRISQLNLVDLAGSERLSDNEARNKEASYIKKSLLALQSVVTSLTELSASASSNSQQKQRMMHVPYRNSQLTRLLQTSLSGNAKVAFLCTISPDPECEVETLSTLRFAAGAKKVVTKAELGQVVDRATLLEALESKVLELEAALLTNADYTEALERERDEAIERADGAAKICYDYEAKIAELQTLRTPLKEQHDHLRRLIITGSPHSSYANQTTIEQHSSPSNNNNNHPNSNNNNNNLNNNNSNRRKSGGGRRASRLSGVVVAAAAAAAAGASPAKKVGWKELFFDDAQTPESKGDIMSTATNAEVLRDETSLMEKINELNLTIAKLEATIVEAEDTHLGEVVELKAEISALESKLMEKGNGSPNSQGEEEELREEVERLKFISNQEIEDLQKEVEQLKALNQEKEARLSQMESELRQLSEKNEFLRETVKTKDSQLEVLEERLKSHATSRKKRIEENSLPNNTNVTGDGEDEEEEEKKENRWTSKVGERSRKLDNSNDGRDKEQDEEREEEEIKDTRPMVKPSKRRGTTGSQRKKKGGNKDLSSSTEKDGGDHHRPVVVRRSTRSTINSNSKNILSSLEKNS
ncbi:P-loop containing nucleoside triphosphate hydrolase protein [Phakopsora pachyrhizi]|uniref:Kinesin-like protein n=1 Tax=Phakopsora pachyrhizi TaxID=170000 RepID=A0AAV0BI54_PHAPC|nr:P-loop containing nucleoside triphosphate hydrolase protein [Phakopsora pachyrhizi]